MIGSRRIEVMDPGCRERSEGRRWLADGEKMEGLENQMLRRGRVTVV